jgi:hypothetical protein
MRRGIFFVFLFVLFGLKPVWSYDDELTHPKITKAIIEKWNIISEHRIGLAEEKWIIEGSIKEDWPATRSTNHFYDPIRDRGLNIVKGVPSFNSAVDWAKSSFLQKKDLGADYSWETAINSYKQGDYKKAFLSLGHILHLLEDMSVPAHVRNDQHIDGDP